MSKYLDRLEKGDHGTTSERRLSKKMGSRLQPASGALAGAKSDARMKGVHYNFRIESKSTVNVTMPLDLGWLTKITNEAQTDHSIPMLTVSFVNALGQPRSARNAEWVMVPLWAFDELKEAAERD
jgi:hypothetical protein